MLIPSRYISPNFPKNESLKGFVFAGANIKDAHEDLVEALAGLAAIAAEYVPRRRPC